MICWLCCWAAGGPAAAQPPLPQDHYATLDQGGIPYWLVLGPMPLGPRESADAMGRVYVKDESALQPVVGEKAVYDHITYQWRGVSGHFPSATAITQDALGNSEYVLFYFATYIKSDREIPLANLYWGSDDSARVYVNGRMVGQFLGRRGLVVDNDITTEFPLHKGVNTIVVKLGNDWLGYGITARLVDGKDRPLADLPIGAVPPKKIGNTVPWSFSPMDEFQPQPHIPATTQFVLSQGKFTAHAEKTATFLTDVSCRLRGVEIHDAATDRLIHTLPDTDASISAPTVSVDKANSNPPYTYAYLCRRKLTFTDFTTPGTYYLYSAAYHLKSDNFTITAK